MTNASLLNIPALKDYRTSSRVQFNQQLLQVVISHVPSVKDEIVGLMNTAQT
ncbi:PTS maltose transporter subunit IIBC [Salmonella enterica subsp. enterica]|nr:PTS maltose transporter subunit IIBC [Salmonella enterica subsp. enterica]